MSDRRLAIFPPSPGVLRRAALAHARGPGLDSFLARSRTAGGNVASSTAWRFESAQSDAEAAEAELLQAERGLVVASIMAAEALADGRRACPPCDARAIMVVALEMLADDLDSGRGEAQVHVDVPAGFKPWPDAALAAACREEAKRLHLGGPLAEW